MGSDTFTCPVCSERVYRDHQHSLDETAAALQEARAEEREALPDDLRAQGWSVAVHNDYRLDGETHTFWLFTHPDGRWLKGEGRTDAEALGQVRRSLSPSPPTEEPRCNHVIDKTISTDSVKCTHCGEWRPDPETFAVTVGAPRSTDTGGAGEEPFFCSVAGDLDEDDELAPAREPQSEEE